VFNQFSYFIVGHACAFSCAVSLVTVALLALMLLLLLLLPSLAAWLTDSPPCCHGDALFIDYLQDIIIWDDSQARWFYAGSVDRSANGRRVSDCWVVAILFRCG
jgi:hypothetical protein